MKRRLFTDANVSPPEALLRKHLDPALDLIPCDGGIEVRLTVRDDEAAGDDAGRARFTQILALRNPMNIVVRERWSVCGEMFRSGKAPIEHTHANDSGNGHDDSLRGGEAHSCHLPGAHPRRLPHPQGGLPAKEGIIQAAPFCGKTGVLSAEEPEWDPVLPQERQQETQ